MLFKYSCLHFPPTIPPHPSHLYIPPLHPTPLRFCPCVLYTIKSNHMLAACVQRDGYKCLRSCGFYEPPFTDLKLSRGTEKLSSRNKMTFV